MTLLKNDNDVLPLTAAASQVAGRPLKIALVGPHLTSTIDLLSSIAYTYVQPMHVK
jgi:beta-glucosidase-like glycosyl hydrolase